MKVLLWCGAVLVVIVAFLCFAPLLMLWGLNTLFEVSNTGVYIPHTFWSYLAVFAILIPFNVSVVSK